MVDDHVANVAVNIHGALDGLCYRRLASCPIPEESTVVPEQRWLEFVPFLTSPARASCCPGLIAEVAGYRAIHSGAA